jgi:hypothetical protein
MQTGCDTTRIARSFTALLIAVIVASACGAGQVSVTHSAAAPSPTPMPSTGPLDAPPSATTAPSPSFEVIGERITAGTHTARPFDPALPDHWGVCAGQSGCTETAADDSIGITYTVPEGWAFGFGAAVTKPSAGTVAPSGMSLHFLRGGWLFSDPCLKVDTTPDIEVGPTADDFAHALAAHPLLNATTPAPVTLGGYSGKYLDLQVPSDISPCPESYYPWAPAFYAQGPNHRWHIWSLDAEGVRVVIQSGDFPATLPEDLAEMHAIIESIQIEP